MADTLAGVDDVAALFGDIAGLEERVESFLRSASALARAKSPGLDARILAGGLDAEAIRDVVAAVVLRALKNPAGVKSQTTGPFSTTYDDRVAAGFVFFTDDEVALLGAGVAGRARFGTLVVRPRW